MDEIRFIGDLQRVEAKPGDVFVLKCERRMSVEQSLAARKYLSDALGGAKVIVLDAGMTLGVCSNPQE